ncbi:hypothetical protein [Desulfovibrio sp. DV]|uniref:hypothetical protein n=1 Tax=Desulfovibrio sp. DV TaxID=1844708 RepID=UPI0011153350|nr:hypothetical protein [Desulfovibrio sp. DV]
MAFDITHDTNLFGANENISNVNIGIGINPLVTTLNSGLRGKCVEFSKLQSLGQVEGGHIEANFFSLDTQLSLFNKTDRELELGVKPKKFNLSAEVSSNIISQINFDYTHSYAVLWVKKFLNL